jgi:hypothetical protein
MTHDTVARRRFNQRNHRSYISVADTTICDSRRSTENGYQTIVLNVSAFASFGLARRAGDGSRVGVSSESASCRAINIIIIINVIIFLIKILSISHIGQAQHARCPYSVAMVVVVVVWCDHYRFAKCR